MKFDLLKAPQYKTYRFYRNLAEWFASHSMSFKKYLKKVINQANIQVPPAQFNDFGVVLCKLNHLHLKLMA
jgi:hypothetical protein